MAVETQQALATALLARLPDVLFVSVRAGGTEFVAQAGYAEIAAPSDHFRDPATIGAHPLDAVLAAPSLKLVVRHPGIDNEELVGTIREIGIAGFAVTHSGAPYVEVMADGVSKGWGLAQLCERLGIAARDVVAFGDAVNDIEMLTWAGHGVAVANAAEQTRAVADEIAAAHTEDGVARVIERLLADGRSIAR